MALSALQRLTECSEYVPSLFSLCLPCVKLPDFVRKAKALYTRDHVAAPCDQLLVFAGLFCMCEEYSATEKEQASAERYDRMARNLKVVQPFRLLAA